MGTHLSKAKVEANQSNAKASTGPVNTVSTRYNAVKHGLLSQGITELDGLDYHDSLTGKFQRYETQIENKLYRALHELERLQRGRKGEKLLVPATVDVGLHSDHEQLASFGNSHQQS